jgi:hypothetical protein
MARAFAGLGAEATRWVAHRSRRTSEPRRVCTSLSRATSPSWKPCPTASVTRRAAEQHGRALLEPLIELRWVGPRTVVDINLVGAIALPEQCRAKAVRERNHVAKHRRAWLGAARWSSARRPAGLGHRVPGRPAGDRLVSDPPTYCPRCIWCCGISRTCHAHAIVPALSLAPPTSGSNLFTMAMSLPAGHHPRACSAQQNREGTAQTEQRPRRQRG